MCLRSDITKKSRSHLSSFESYMTLIGPAIVYPLSSLHILKWNYCCEMVIACNAIHSHTIPSSSHKSHSLVVVHASKEDALVGRKSAYSKHCRWSELWRSHFVLIVKRQQQQLLGFFFGLQNTAYSNAAFC